MDFNAAKRDAMRARAAAFIRLVGERLLSSRRHLSAGCDDGHFQRRGLHPAFGPGLIRQPDLRLADANCAGDLDQVLKNVASAPFLKRDRSGQALVPSVGVLENKLSFRMCVAGNRVGIEHEGKRPRADARRADAQLKHRLLPRD